MSGNTSVTLGKHYDRFIARQIKSGHFGTVSEAIRSGLRLLEDREARLKAMRDLLIEGEESGIAKHFSFASLKKKLNKRRRPQ
jgi:antitoxin ParD1/3/4